MCFDLIRDPTLCLPQCTVSTFNHLPIPLSKAFPRKAEQDGTKHADIQAVVLDKDNCFAVPHTNEVYKPYNVCIRTIDVVSLLSCKTSEETMPTISIGPLSEATRCLSWFEAVDSIQYSRHRL